jgi:DNA sulfur modification protein DndC
MKNVAAGALDLLDGAELDAKLSAIRADMLDEYMQPHGDPWVAGFPGGKDSTVVAHPRIRDAPGTPAPRSLAPCPPCL